MCRVLEKRDKKLHDEEEFRMSIVSICGAIKLSTDDYDYGYEWTFLGTIIITKKQYGCSIYNSSTESILNLVMTTDSAALCIQASHLQLQILPHIVTWRKCICSVTVRMRGASHTHQNRIILFEWLKKTRDVIVSNRNHWWCWCLLLMICHPHTHTYIRVRKAYRKFARGSCDFFLTVGHTIYAFRLSYARRY